MTTTMRPPLAPYGEVLDDLMRDRGFRSTADLSRFLQANGVKKGTAQQTLSYHMLGRNAPKPTLVDKILDLLEATKEERDQLKTAYWETDWGSAETS